jgi:hypothetical protein
MCSSTDDLDLRTFLTSMVLTANRLTIRPRPTNCGGKSEAVHGFAAVRPAPCPAAVRLGQDVEHQYLCAASRGFTRLSDGAGGRTVTV